MITSSVRFDEETTIFTQRELTRVRARVYEREYPMKKMANGEIIPISIQTDFEWDDYIEVEEYDVVGIAAVIADYSKGGPRVGNVVRRVFYKIKTVGDHAGWSWEEINKARTHNKPLREQRLRAAREAADNYLNQGGYDGDTDFGLPGIFTLPIPRFTSIRPFAQATSTDDLLAMLNASVRGMMIATNGMAMPRKLVLPQKQFGQIHDTYRASGSDQSVAEAFLNTQSIQGLISQIICDDNLKGKGDNGTDAGLILPDDEDKICLGVQMPFNMLPEQQINLEFVVHGVMRTSLVQCLYPMESLIIQGI